MKRFASKAIILFDGHCNFCEGWVRKLAKADKNDRLRFSAFTSPAVAGLIEKYNLNDLGKETVIVIKDEQVYTKSDAVLIILHTLGGFWALLDFWTIFPHKWNDAFYDWFSSKRYQWFGKKQQCMLPDENIKSKFIL